MNSRVLLENIYRFLSKIFFTFHKIKVRLYGLPYYLFKKVWFRKLGTDCVFFSFVRFLYIFRDVKVGYGCKFGYNVFINCGPNGYIMIGNNVGLSDYTSITALYGIEIGDDTRIGEFVTIRDNDHTFMNSSIPIRLQGYHGDKVTIGKDVWIGRGVYIGKGINIGNGAVIGANSVVTKSIPSFAIAVGSPARVIKYRQSKT